jgi:hypothetical protein
MIRALLCRHPGEDRDPLFLKAPLLKFALIEAWVPAFAGMTAVFSF